MKLLPSQIGTHKTDINAAEAQALALSLMQAPLHTPTVFILDSKTVFTAVISYFLPTHQPPRQRMRHTYSSISLYYTGLLYHLLDKHHPMEQPELDTQLLLQYYKSPFIAPSSPT